MCHAGNSGRGAVWFSKDRWYFILGESGFATTGAGVGGMGDDGGSCSVWDCRGGRESRVIEWKVSEEDPDPVALICGKSWVSASWSLRSEEDLASRSFW